MQTGGRTEGMACSISHHLLNLLKAKYEEPLWWKRFLKNFLRKGHWLIFSHTGQFPPDPGHQIRLLALPNKLAEKKGCPALTFHDLEVSFFPLVLFFGLTFCHSAFNCALSWPVLLYQCRMMTGRKETWLGQAGDILCRQELCSWPAVTTVTGYSKLFSKTRQLFHSLKSSATATAPLLSTLLSFMFFLSIFIIKSSKSIFTPIVVIWEMNKKIKPFLLC